MLRQQVETVGAEGEVDTRSVQPLEGPAIYTLLLEGELGLRELAEVGEELFRLMHQARRNVVIDFAEVSHIDYRGVKPLLARTELFRRAGGDIKLSGLSPYLKAILRAAGAHSLFELYPSFHDAKAAFLRAPRPLC